MQSKLAVAAMLASAFALTGAGSTVTAQTSVASAASGGGAFVCTVSCNCQSGGCTCSSSGGKGSSCTNNGNECTVYNCDPQGPALGMMFGPDGSVFAMELMLDPSGTVPRLVATSAQSPVGGWTKLQTGQIVVRNCRGIVVAQYFDPPTAAQFRNQTRIVI